MRAAGTALVVITTVLAIRRPVKRLGLGQLPGFRS
jgi:hypothetical protein